MILADMGAEVVRIDRIPAAGSSGFEAMKREVSPIDRGAARWLSTSRIRAGWASFSTSWPKPTR